MALNFDGVDDRLRWSTAVQALRLVGDMSYCAWVQYDTLGGVFDNVIVSYGGTGRGDDDDNYFYFLSVDSDKTLRLYWEAAGGAGVNVTSSTPGTFAAATWVHLGFTRDAAAKSVKFYVNGAQLGTAVSYSDNPAYGPDFGKYSLLVTGADSVDPGTYNWDGRIAETGTWNRVLSGSEFAAIGSGARPWAPSMLASGLVSYCPLYGYDDGVLHLFPADDEITGRTAIKDGTDVFGVTHPVVWRSITAQGRGQTAALASYVRTGRGLYRGAYESYVRQGRGQNSLLAGFGTSGRGLASQANSFTPVARGGHRVGYLSYGATGRGVHARYAGYSPSWRGAHRSGYDSYLRAGRGQHAVLFGYRLSGRGTYRFVTLTITQRAGGAHRTANAALDRYELYRGVDAPPNLGAAPWQTFTTLPFTTPALAAGHTYTFVLRRRNAWGLLSQNIGSSSVTIAGDGTQTSTPPSAPTNVAVSASAARTLLVTADYAYGADGPSAADSFVVFTRVGSDPDPTSDTPVAVLEAVRSDGVAKLEYTTAAAAEGSTVRVIVRTRRTGPPLVDSTNLDVHAAVATDSGPAAASSSAHLGRVAELAQGEVAASVAGLVLWLRADRVSGVADGAGVAAWGATGGNGYSFAQATGSKQPLYRATAVNGLPALEFDGVDDYLSGSAAALTNTVRRTVFVVTKILSTLPGVRPVIANGTGDWYAAGSTSNVSFSSHLNAAFAQKLSSGTAGAFSTSAFNVLAYRWETAGSNVNVDHFKNGAANGSAAYADGYGPLNSPTFFIGAFNAASLFYPGQVAELLVYDSALSAADRRTVETYLGRKYGISVP